MPTRTTFTSITPLPPNVTRETALAFLHNHLEMIDLNPLVIERHAIPPPEDAEPEERECAWYSMTDKISYIPSTDLLSGEVVYCAAFHDLPTGLQTHVRAPMGLDMREKWSVGGRLPDEPPETQELGLGAPATGLYIREDVDFRCNVLMANFVKKTIKKSHGAVIEAMGRKAEQQQAESAARASSSQGAGFQQKQQQQHDAFVGNGSYQGQQGQGPPGMHHMQHQHQHQHQQHQQEEYEQPPVYYNPVPSSPPTLPNPVTPGIAELDSQFTRQHY